MVLNPVHLGQDAAGASGAGMFGLAPDQCDEPLAQVVRRHQKLARRGRMPPVSSLKTAAA
jgi:hypothetical protein